jgi:hypothetical protein
MLALTTIGAAAIGCLATVASVDAGEAEFEGMTAAVKAQEAAIINAVQGFEQYEAFTLYHRNNLLGNLLADASAASSGPDAARLETEARESWGLALGLQNTFFSPRYLNQDGSYNLDRQLGEAWAEDALQNDLFPEPHFQTANDGRFKAILLSSLLIPFAIAFWGFTLANVIENRSRYFFSVLGVLASLSAILIYVGIEVML